MLNNKGQMRTVEAFLAILLLFSALAIATSVSPADNPDYDNTLESEGIQVLVSINNEGQLGKMIDKRNWTALTDALDTLLPVGISYNLNVYNEDLQKINNVSISNGLIMDQNVVSIQYPCISQTPQANCYLVRLQLAKAG